MHLADAIIQSDLHCIQAIHFLISMCVPRELNPQPFALYYWATGTKLNNTSKMIYVQFENNHIGKEELL